MITKTVTIDGKEVTFAASAAIPRFYRLKFGRDILVDMEAIRRAMAAQRAPQKKGSQGDKMDVSTLPLEALTLFENVAYIMAKHADKDNVPGAVDDWLDGFETFSIYQIFPVIQALWSENLRQLNTPQKK